MQHRSANTRYRIIDRCLRDKRNPYPILAYLIDVCSKALDRDSDVGKSINGAGRVNFRKVISLSSIPSRQNKAQLIQYS